MLSPMAATAQAKRSPGKIVAVVVAILAVILLAWAVFGGGDDDASASAEPVIVEVDELRAVGERLGHPIYWAGAREGVRYELTETDSGRVFIRYLEDGADAGEREGEFLIVSTYPAGDGPAALRRAARGNDSAELGKSGAGASVLINRDTPSNVHLAFPDGSEQIEIYSPNTEEALDLAINDKIQPVP